MRRHVTSAAQTRWHLEHRYGYSTLRIIKQYTVHGDQSLQELHVGIVQCSTVRPIKPFKRRHQIQIKKSKLITWSCKRQQSQASATAIPLAGTWHVWSSQLAGYLIEDKSAQRRRKKKEYLPEQLRAISPAHSDTKKKEETAAKVYLRVHKPEVKHQT